MKKSAEELTLDDMGEFLEICKNAYTGMPPEGTQDILGSLPPIDQYLQSALGRLYMYRLISQRDLERMAMQTIAWCSQWACVSFGIGLEAGLGHIADEDVEAYLSAFNQPYMRSLLDFLALLLDHGKVDISYASRVRGELSNYINDASVLLADTGHVSCQSFRTRYEGTESPVVAFLREIDVSAADAGMG